MSDNVLSVAVRFMEIHRYSLGSDDPGQWVPEMNAARGIARNKHIYVFHSTTGNPFELMKVCTAGPDGKLTDVSADNAFSGKLPIVAGKSVTTQLPLSSASVMSRMPDTVQTSPVRYFFYASRTVLERGDVDVLAGSPPAEIPIVSLQAISGPAQTIPVLDPLTVTEQLSNDYEEKRRARFSIDIPFAEQSSTERQTTNQAQVQETIAGVLDSLDSRLKGKLNAKYAKRPSKFLKEQELKKQSAEEKRELAAEDLILWLERSESMEFARLSYRATDPPQNWKDDIVELIKAECSACARVADSYNGVVFVRRMIQKDNFLIKSFAGREEDTSSNPNLANLQKIAKTAWDVITKFWLAIGAVSSALSARTGVRAVQPNLDIPLVKLVRTYNTVFGDAEIVKIVKQSEGFTFKDPLSGRLHQVLVNSDAIALDTSVIISLQTQQSHPNKSFTSEHFARGIAVVNLGLAIAAAQDALIADGSQSASDKFFSGLKLLGSVVDTAGAFPQRTAQLLKLTGRGIAFIALAGTVIGLATGFADINDSLKTGDKDAAFGAALVTAGGLVAGVGHFIVWANGGVVVASASLAFGIAAALIILGTAIFVLVTDSDMEEFAEHCFLGKRHGQDTPKPSWSSGRYEEWDDGDAGLAHQLHALFNLVFAFSCDEKTGGLSPNFNTLRIRHGALPPGGFFVVEVRAAIQPPTGPRTEFAATLKVDPTGQVTGDSSLEPNSVVITPATGEVVISLKPRGVDLLSNLVQSAEWRVVLDVSKNKVRNSSGGSAGYIAEPAQVPASGKKVLVKNFGSELSTSF